MNKTYINLFVLDVLKLNEERFDLSNVLVLPNEAKKSEYKEIDILVVNKSRSQAIIIENKIDAKDSNNDSKRDGYKGQLERYYNTIKTGIDKNGNDCTEYRSNKVYVFYLGINKSPTEFSIGMLKNESDSWGQENILSYDFHIREWLKKCIEATPNEKLLVKTFIQHYLNLVDRVTHNDIPIEERMKLKNIVAENISVSKYFIENFKHVKWHTLHEFWTELKIGLEKRYKNVSFYADESLVFEKAIEAVTHQNKVINHGILFDIDGEKFYISGFGKISWGIVRPKRWANFINEIIEDINFSDFSSESTYLLIDRKNMMSAVKAIIDEISSSENNNFENLNSI